ncbi:hydrophobin [Mycena crocata]|nr:hydrophobin [Mycena crocata]
MFAKVSIVASSVLIALAAAQCTPPPTNPPPKASQCCSSVVSSTSTSATAVASLLNIDLSGLNVLVGLSCSPITVFGTGNCGGTAVSCNVPDPAWGGLIAIDCLPITF